MYNLLSYLQLNIKKNLKGIDYCWLCVRIHGKSPHEYPINMHNYASSYIFKNLKFFVALLYLKVNIKKIFTLIDHWLCISMHNMDQNKSIIIFSTQS